MAQKNQEFSARLKEAMAKAGYRRQNELAKVVGISANAMTNYVAKGQVPEWDILVRIARSLDVSCDWLLTGAGEGEGKPAVAQTEATTQLGADQLPEERIRELLEKAEKVLKTMSSKRSAALEEILEAFTKG